MSVIIYPLTFLALKFNKWFFGWHKPEMGIEPMTFFLPRKRSTTELLRQWWVRPESNRRGPYEQLFYRQSPPPMGLRTRLIILA